VLYSNVFTKKLNFKPPQLTLTIKKSSATALLEFQIFPKKGITKRDLEAGMFLCLPRGAAISQFSILMQGEWRKGLLISRKSANYTYKKIVAKQRQKLRPKDPGLLEYLGNDVYRLKLFPISKKGMFVKITWQQPLFKKGNKIEIPLPYKNLKKLSSRIASMKINITSDCPMTNLTLKQQGWKIVPARNRSFKYSHNHFSIRSSALSFIKKYPRLRTYPKIIRQKQILEQFWKSYQNNLKISWQQLMKKCKQTQTVNILHSMIALEKGMKVQNAPNTKTKQVNIKIDNTTFSGDVGIGGSIDDGYGGPTSSIIVDGSPRNLIFSLVKNNILSSILKSYGKKRLEKLLQQVYSQLKSRNINTITKLLTRFKLIQPGRSQLWLITNTTWADKVHGKMNKMEQNFRNSGYQTNAKNNLMGAIRLHIITEFFKRINLIRYGITPWELYIKLFHKNSQ